jgi:hypothetical protein
MAYRRGDCRNERIQHRVADRIVPQPRAEQFRAHPAGGQPAVRDPEELVHHAVLILTPQQVVGGSAGRFFSRRRWPALYWTAGDPTRRRSSFRQAAAVSGSISTEACAKSGFVLSMNFSPS